MNVRLLAFASVALLVACGRIAPETDEAPVPGPDASVESVPDAQAEGPMEPVDASADAPPDAPEPPCMEGDVTVRTPSDAALLASITCIRGSLTIDTTGPIALPRLREVSGSVVLERTSPAVTFPALEVIGADLRVVAWGLSTLSLPLLRDVAGKFAVGEREVTSIAAPRLESVGGVEVVLASWLQNLSLPALKKISGGAKFFLSGLEALAFPKLERVEGTFDVESMTQLATVDLPRLREVVGDVKFVSLPAPVTALTFPALEHVGSFRVDQTSHHLEAVSFPALSHVGQVTIDAPGLMELSLPVLVECGGLLIDEVALTTLRLPELKKATGKIWLRGTPTGKPRLASVELPKLEEAEDVWLGNAPQLASIDLARLRSVTNDLGLARAPRVTQLSLPSLTSVGGLNAYALATITTVSAPVLPGSATTTISIREAPMLTRVELPAVKALERVDLSELDQLAKFSLPAATAVASMEIADLPALTSFVFPVLETIYNINLFDLRTLSHVDVPQLASLSALEIQDAPRFANLGRLATVPTSLQYLHLMRTGAESVAFPNLVQTGQLLLSDNDALTTISFPALLHVSTAYVRYSPKLPECAVDAINARLVTGEISTRELAACAP